MYNVVYEVKYANGERTITGDMETIILFVRDTKVNAEVSAWCNGNCIAFVEIKPRLT